MTDNNKPQQWVDPCAGYREPIARAGEQQFACILRNRSGIDAGSIDFGARFIDGLNANDQQDAIESAYSIYLKWCDETGMRSRRDTAAPQPAQGEG